MSPAAEKHFLGGRAAEPMGPPLVRVIPFGLERTVSYGAGTAKGPAAILDASARLPLFDLDRWRTPAADFAVDTLIEPNIPERQEDALDMLEALVEAALADGAFPLTLGGEHGLTPGALRPFLRRHEDLVLLHFDAHADLRDGYDGEHFSHAAAIRRCLDDDRLSTVSIGIRNISASEIPFYEANRDRVHLHFAADRASWRLEDMLAPLRDRPIYVSFDLDGFDASVMGATGTPEPGGLFWQDVVPILRGASEAGRFVGADVVELAPRRGAGACDLLGAQLAYEILACAFSPRAT